MYFAVSFMMEGRQNISALWFVKVYGQVSSKDTTYSCILIPFFLQQPIYNNPLW